MILNPGDERVGQRYQTSPAPLFATRSQHSPRTNEGPRGRGAENKVKTAEAQGGEASEVAGGGRGCGKGRRSCRSRGRGCRGCGRGQQGAEEVAGAKAEAAEVARGGQLGQGKSMAAAQRAKPLKKQSCQGRGNQGAAAAAALLRESFPFG